MHWPERIVQIRSVAFSLRQAPAEISPYVRQGSLGIDPHRIGIQSRPGNHRQTGTSKPRPDIADECDVGTKDPTRSGDRYLTTAGRESNPVGYRLLPDEPNRLP